MFMLFISDLKMISSSVEFFMIQKASVPKSSNRLQDMQHTHNDSNDMITLMLFLSIIRSDVFRQNIKDPLNRFTIRGFLYFDRLLPAVFIKE